MLKKIIQYGIICLFFTGLCFSSCKKEEQKEKEFDEGVIKYKIEYLNYSKDNVLHNVLPETMTVAFKDNNTRLKIEGFFGIFKFSQISNKEKKINATLLKLLDKKYKYTESIDSMATGFKKMNNLDYTDTEETKEIAGYTCNKIIVHRQDSVNKTYPIYSTDQIQIDSPNINTPYLEIDDVLLEFIISLNDIKMKIKAIDVTAKNISDKIFTIPNGYKSLSEKKMKNKMKKFNK